MLCNQNDVCWLVGLGRRALATPLTTTMVVQVISSYDQFKQVINGDKPVVIDFWATWCGPCKMISPIFDKISESPAGEKLGFYKVDVDEQGQIAQEVGIRAMPTFVVFKNGEKVETVVGADPSKLQVRCVYASRCTNSRLPFQSTRLRLETFRQIRTHYFIPCLVRPLQRPLHSRRHAPHLHEAGPSALG